MALKATRLLREAMIEARHGDPARALELAHEAALEAAIKGRSDMARWFDVAEECPESGSRQQASIPVARRAPRRNRALHWN